jgi:hypothetical protein
MADLGAISLAQGFGRATLAASATFQTWVGAADATEALDSIYDDGLPVPANKSSYTKAELQALRPFAMIWTDEADGFSMERTAVSGPSSLMDWQSSGRLELHLEMDVPAELADDPAGLDLSFRNTIGQIFDEVAVLAGAGGMLAITSMAVSFGPYRTDTDKVPQQGDAIAIDLIWEWRS